MLTDTRPPSTSILAQSPGGRTMDPRGWGSQGYGLNWFSIERVIVCRPDM